MASLATLPEEFLGLAINPDDDVKSLATLPEELLDLVIDHIDDVKSLATLSAVSQSFHRLVEPYLYRHILLKFTEILVGSFENTTSVIPRSVTVIPHMILQKSQLNTYVTSLTMDSLAVENRTKESPTSTQLDNQLVSTQDVGPEAWLTVVATELSKFNFSVDLRMEQELRDITKYGIVRSTISVWKAILESPVVEALAFHGGFLATHVFDMSFSRIKHLMIDTCSMGNLDELPYSRQDALSYVLEYCDELQTFSLIYGKEYDGRPEFESFGTMYKYHKPYLEACLTLARRGVALIELHASGTQQIFRIKNPLMGPFDLRSPWSLPHVSPLTSLRLAGTAHPYHGIDPGYKFRLLVHVLTVLRKIEEQYQDEEQPQLVTMGIDFLNRIADATEDPVEIEMINLDKFTDKVVQDTIEWLMEEFDDYCLGVEFSVETL